MGYEPPVVERDVREIVARAIYGVLWPHHEPFEAFDRPQEYAMADAVLAALAAAGVAGGAAELTEDEYADVAGVVADEVALGGGTMGAGHRGVFGVHLGAALRDAGFVLRRRPRPGPAGGAGG